MSSNLRSLMIFAGGVAIGAIGIFALQNPTTPQEDVTGAIGTVDKVHQDQIGADDVILANGESPGDIYATEWLDEVATADDIAGLLDLASAQERTNFASRMPFEMQVAMLSRYDAADLGKAYRAMQAEGKVQFFRSLPEATQRSWVQSKSMSMADFEARGLTAQAKTVADLGNREIAAGMREFQTAARQISAERAQMKGELPFARVLPEQSQGAAQAPLPLELPGELHGDPRRKRVADGPPAREGSARA